jgi:hypothetical protein
MAEDVMRPLTADLLMERVATDGSSTSETADSYIKPNALLGSSERLEIYNRQYWFRVIGAVSEDFPALNALLGPRLFDRLILAYLRQNPSTSFTLRDLGAKLPTWLQEHPEFAGRRHSLAVDVARLEWAYIEAFDGASVIPLGLSDFATIGPDSTVHLQPHVQLLHLRYPVDDLVLAVRSKTPELDIVSNASSEKKQAARIPLPKIERSTVYLVVHRFEDSVYYRRIDREAFLLLNALKAGGSIAVAISKAFAPSNLTPEEQATETQKYFAHAAEVGWFSLSAL